MITVRSVLKKGGLYSDDTNSFYKEEVVCMKRFDLKRSRCMSKACRSTEDPHVPTCILKTWLEF